MKTLIIAEKPSLAKEIRDMLTKSFNEHFIQKDDYHESGNYLISSFFGHLLQMSKPDTYHDKYKSWTIENLPIIPDNFIYEYKDSTKSRGKLLKKLSQECSLIVNATDPDREGEGIFRIWYNFENITKPFKRLWATSLTLADLTKAWRNLKDSKELDSLAAAQQARSQADWLVGMNASRLYTILTYERCPVGRVKTATLSIIVKRDEEVENYKESFTYELKGNWGGFPFSFIDDDNNTRFENKNSLELIKTAISGKPFSLLSFTKDEKKQNPPKTYSQPDLQKDADNKLGFSLDKTLSITQSLYEKKLVTYPRTDSPYLPESDLQDYYKLIHTLASPEQEKYLLPGTRPASVKNTDSPHTAIIPTGQQPDGLSADETALYNLIKERFIVAFMEPKIYDEYVIFIHHDNYKFRTILKSVKSLGFQSVYKPEEEKETDEAQAPEVMAINENMLKSIIEIIKDLAINAVKKTKPKYFTPATLLTAMMNAGKNLESKEDRDIMKEVEGLGTAATRQLYPVELEKDGFIYKKGKYLISSDKGRKLIMLIAPELKSVEKTAQLEQSLRAIEGKQYSEIKFKKDIHDYVNSFLSQAIGNRQTIETTFSGDYKCPKCKGQLTHYKCTACGFILYTKIAGKELEQKHIEQLFNTGHTDTIKGFTGKNGKFDAKLKFSEEFKVVFDFEKDTLGNCSCGGEVIESPKAYNCKNCKKTVWKETFGKKITIKQAVALMQGKKVNMTGLKGKEKTFDAALFLDNEGKIKLDFGK